MKQKFAIRFLILILIGVISFCSDMLEEPKEIQYVYVLSTTGLHFTADNGQTWEKKAEFGDLIVDNTGYIFVRNGTIYVAGGSLAVSGISILENGSTIWVKTSTNDGSFPFVPDDIYVDENGIIFVTSLGSGLYKSIDNGASFTQISAEQIASVYVNNGIIYAGGVSGNTATLWRYQYDGTLIGAALDIGKPGQGAVNGFVTDIKRAGNRLFASIDSSADDKGYLMMLDLTTMVWDQLHADDGYFCDIAIQTNNEDTIYIAVYDAVEGDAGLAFLDFNTLIVKGDTSTADGMASNNCTQVAVTSSGCIYVVTDRQLSVSENGSLNWSWTTKDTLAGTLGFVYDVIVANY